MFGDKGEMGREEEGGRDGEREERGWRGDLFSFFYIMLIVVGLAILYTSR